MTSKPRPGVLPIQALRELVENGQIHSTESIAKEQFQPASLDLTLGPVAYRVRASFLPGSAPVVDILDRLVQYELDLRKGATLERGVVYIIPLQERLDLPPDLHARTNPRSTIGRLDVFTRTITDYSHRFEEIVAGYRGRLYLEVVPGTFAITVHQGQSLNQIRIIRGNPIIADAEIRGEHERIGLVIGADSAGDVNRNKRVSDGLWLSVALRREDGGPHADHAIGYRSVPSSDVIDIGKMQFYNPREFWERRDGHGEFILQPEDFYIVASAERVRVPTKYAAEMIAYDYFSGELRTHYAGFFDPGFGFGVDGEVGGTFAVLEVRSHEVPFRLAHRQLFCRLKYEMMADVPEISYGTDAGSTYQWQGLQLAKQFKEWR